MDASGKAALLLIAEALWFIVLAIPPALGAQGASLKPAKYRTLNPQLVRRRQAAGAGACMLRQVC